MRLFSISLAMAAALACSGPTEPPESPETYEQLGRRLAKILADSAAANGVIGAQAAVRIPGQQPWIGVTGLNGTADPMRSELLIGTGSISKMYAAAAALVLVDRGTISFTDPIGRWFPNTPNVDPGLTVLRLLQNTSGLADYSAGPNYAQVIFADPQRAWRPDELLAFVGSPLFPPGTAWNASNTNRLLLGMIVERETGQSLGAFMRSEVHQGLTATWLSGDSPPPDALATQWVVDGTGKRTNANQFLFGPALFSSRREIQASAGDVAAFAERLFAGDLLTAATRAAMLTIVPDDGGIAGQTGGGLGIRRYNYLNRTLYGHSGATGNSTGLVLFDPATGIIAAVSVNQGGPSHGNSHFRTTPALLKAAIEFASLGANRQ